MLQLFERHAETLREVELSYLWLMDVEIGWPGVIRWMKKHMALDTVEFDKLWGEDLVGPLMDHTPSFPDRGRRWTMRTFPTGEFSPETWYLNHDDSSS